MGWAALVALVVLAVSFGVRGEGPLALLDTSPKPEKPALLGPTTTMDPETEAIIREALESTTEEGAEPYCWSVPTQFGTEVECSE